MSETVFYTGKIKEIGPKLNETLNEAAERIVKDKKIDAKWLENNDYVDLIHAYCDNSDVIIINNKIYEVLEISNNQDDEDIFEVSENSDGTLSYSIKYYNGGCGFIEAIEIALNKLNQKPLKT